MPGFGAVPSNPVLGLFRPARFWGPPGPSRPRGPGPCRLAPPRGQCACLGRPGPESPRLGRARQRNGGTMNRLGKKANETLIEMALSADGRRGAL